MNSREGRSTVALAIAVSLLLAGATPGTSPIRAAETKNEASPPASEMSSRAQAQLTPARPNKVHPISLDLLAKKVARNPGIPYLLNEYGNELLRRARPLEAVQRFEEAVDLNPEYLLAWNNLGVARYALGQFRKAETAYERAIELSPNYAMAHYNLGVAFDARGAYDKAIESYKRAIELDPGLLELEKNPQIASNRHIAAILVSAYLDRGGSFVLPTQSVYPDR